jgi:hypothetical protein
MTVREFFQKYNLKVSRGCVVLYKGLENTKSPTITAEGNQIEYKKGKVIEDKYVNYRVYNECAHGLHVCPTEELASRWGNKVVKVKINIMDFVAIPNDGSKVRVKRLKVLN